jgi:hypothetical protein
VESFEAKPPDFAALEVGLKGAALVCSCRSAQLAPKCHGGTFKLSVPRRRAPQQGGLEAAHGSPKVVFLVSWSSLHCCVSSRSLRCVMAVLDVTSSRFRSRGVTSWVRAKLLVCGPCFRAYFIFPLCLN